MKELNDEERRKNVERAFLVKENVVKYKKILLVDDIYTTGATIDSCAKVLYEKGAQKVYFLCLCGERILRKCRERQNGRIGYGC
jgi:predicted amidophosphoribosyltransferase